MGKASHSSFVQAGRVARWIPALAALLVFGQVCLLGLRPALEESRRLDAAEARMHERHATALEHQVSLERTLQAQRDPIYLERERKHLLSPGRPARADQR